MDPVKGPRVCLVFESYYPVVGGMERQGKALAEGLAARGIPLMVVTLRNRPALQRREKLDGYDVHRVSPGGRWSSTGSLLGKLLALRDEYDLIYVSGLRWLGVPAVLAGGLGRKPVVLKATNNGELSGGFFDPGLQRLGLTHRSLPVRPLNYLRKAVLRRASGFLAMAESVRREFLEEGVPPQRVALIPDGVDMTRFRPSDPAEKERLRAGLGLPAEGRIVCFTGRMVAWKGPLTLLAAWEQVISAESRRGAIGGRPRDLLIFLGSGGTDLDNCEDEARRFQAERGLSDSVRFMGDVRNVEDYLRASDIFAFPTVDDLFPLVMLEAMACSLAVVTTPIAGLVDYVVHERNALLVPPGQVAPVRDALLRLLKEADLRRRLGSAALETAQGFSAAKVVDRHLELFGSLVKGSG
jgi:glycosyltransferase involved in cell wall biosynthesis